MKSRAHAIHACVSILAWSHAGAAERAAERAAAPAAVSLAAPATQSAAAPAVQPAAPAAPAEVDALVASPDRYRLLLENEHVRVLEYTLHPGERDAWHTHPPKVSYVVRGGRLRVHRADGTSITVEDTAGTATWADSVPRHYVENVGDTPVTIVLTEVKSAASSPAGEEQRVIDAVAAMFAALATDDVAKFRAIVAPDFHAFDVGERFTGDELMELIRKRHAEGVAFEWRVTEPRVRVDGRTAWITYVNRGAITNAAGRKDVVWLESVVLQEEAGAWRIRFLHSTRVP